MIKALDVLVEARAKEIEQHSKSDADKYRKLNQDMSALLGTEEFDAVLQKACAIYDKYTKPSFIRDIAAGITGVQTLTSGKMLAEVKKEYVPKSFYGKKIEKLIKEMI